MGLNDLNTMVKLNHDITVSIRTLIKSLPASQGMSRPQLFHHVEQNTSGGLTLATFQECDRKYIQDRKMTLENELRSLLEKGEDEKLFQSCAEGLWFDNVHKTKKGQILTSKLASKNDLEHIQYTRTILSSPPKKRLNTAVSGSSQATQGSVAPDSLPPPQVTQHQTKINHTPITTNTMTVIHERFVTVENELRLQNERNAIFDQRITSLETTTKCSDRKLDIILSKLEQWDDNTPSKQRKINTEHQDQPMGEASLPQASPYDNYMGSTEP
jgi:hypothetical protein